VQFSCLKFTGFYQKASDRKETHNAEALLSGVVLAAVQMNKDIPDAVLSLSLIVVLPTTLAAMHVSGVGSPATKLE